MPYGGIGAYVYNQVNNISKCALGHKMCGLGIEMWYNEIQMGHIQIITAF